MSASPELRASLIHVMRLSGIPISIEAESAGPTPPRSPSTADADAHIDQVAIGMSPPDLDTRAAIGRQISFIRMHALSPLDLAARGHRSLAVDRAAAVIQVVEELAALGSEHAADMLLHYADLYQDAGISAEAFDLARRRLEVEA